MDRGEMTWLQRMEAEGGQAMGKTALTSRAHPSKCLAVEVASPLTLSPQLP